VDGRADGTGRIAERAAGVWGGAAAGPAARWRAAAGRDYDTTGMCKTTDLPPPEPDPPPPLPERQPDYRDDPQGWKDWMTGRRF
jgi:hypothetical protein